MKITSHNPSTIKENQAFNQAKKVEGQKKSTSDVKNVEDSVKINQNTLSENIKDINNNIGSLQIAINHMDMMNSDAKELSVVSKKLQNKQDINQNSQKASNIKTNLVKDYEEATFNGENVFSKNYSKIIPESKFSPNLIRPSKVSQDDSMNVEKFLKVLNEQKQYAKETIQLLNNKLQNQTNELKKTDVSYNQIDKTALNQEEFKNAHNTKGITLERLSKLLG